MEFSEDRAHCSNHVYYANGCPDCEIYDLYSVDKLEKAVRTEIHELKIEPGNPGPTLQLIRQELARKIYIFFQNSITDVNKAIKKHSDELTKSATGIEILLLAGVAAIQWRDFIAEVVSNLYHAVMSGGMDGLKQLNIQDGDVEKALVNSAEEYSKSRSAEMIGKKWVDNKLVDNINAKYVISDVTRDDLRDLIEKAIQQKSSISELQAEIEKSSMFSKTRARLIAETEMSFAQVQGNLEVWKSSGSIKTVGLVLSLDHSVEDICDDIASQGPWAIENVPQVPIHPNCFCGLEAIELS